MFFSCWCDWGCTWDLKWQIKMSRNTKKDRCWRYVLHWHHFARKYVWFLSKDSSFWFFRDRKSIWKDVNHLILKTQQKIALYWHYFSLHCSNKCTNFHIEGIFLWDAKGKTNIFPIKTELLGNSRVCYWSCGHRRCTRWRNKIFFTNCCRRLWLIFLFWSSLECHVRSASIFWTR